MRPFVGRRIHAVAASKREMRRLGMVSRRSKELIEGPTAGLTWGQRKPPTQSAWRGAPDLLGLSEKDHILVLRLYLTLYSKANNTMP